MEGVQQVDRAPDGGVEEDAGAPGERVRERREVGDPAVGDDQLGVGIRLHEAGQLLGDRRQAAAAVDQDRNAPLGSEREHGRQPLVVQEEPLRARMELDPPGAEVEAARRLLDRLLSRGRAGRTG